MVKKTKAVIGTIGDNELKAFKRAAEVSLAFDDEALQKLLIAGELMEVHCNE